MAVLDGGKLEMSCDKNYNMFQNTDLEDKIFFFNV